MYATKFKKVVRINFVSTFMVFWYFAQFFLSVVSVLRSESIQLTMNIENILVSRFNWLGISG